MQQGKGRWSAANIAWLNLFKFKSLIVLLTRWCITSYRSSNVFSSDFSMFEGHTGRNKNDPAT